MGYCLNSWKLFLFSLIIIIFIPAFSQENEISSSIHLYRYAFYRGEEIPVYVNCINNMDTPFEGTVSVGLNTLPVSQTHSVAIAPKQTQQLYFRIPTASVKVGTYKLQVAMKKNGTTISLSEKKITLSQPPNPHRMEIWLWGGGGNQWYRDHGFTTWTGPSWKDNFNADKARLDEGLQAGADCGLRPNGGLRDVDPAQFSNPDARNKGIYPVFKNPIANPFCEDVIRYQNEKNKHLMEFAQRYPQIRTAFFNTEIVDELMPNINKTGIRMLREKLGFSDTDIEKIKTMPRWSGGKLWPAQYVRPHVIADNDKSYNFHKYIYKEGNGLAAANARTAAMIKRYRQDIITINDPYRETALYDLFPGMDVISTWTYTNPDPKLMLYIETLRAACKPTGQIPMQTITLLNYAGELMPTDEWTLMGPGRTCETTWINLSRAPKMLGYYYSSMCNPEKEDSIRVPYSTSLAIKELSEKVFKPYGPFITRLEVTPRKIAVLSSAAARLYGKSPQLRGGYANMQIYHFYSLLAMIHLQADVVFDETIERYGLDAYDMLVLPKCDVLTETVYNRILEFQKRGGIIVADQYLGPEIPGVYQFDFDFTYRKKVNANAIIKNKNFAQWNDHLKPGSAEVIKVKGVTAKDDQRIMEAYAEELRTELNKLIRPDVDCDNLTVLLNMLEKDGIHYLAVVNDKRDYDKRIGQYKSMLGEIIPQDVSITLRKWQNENLYVYDMLKRKQLKVTHDRAGFHFNVSLTKLGGTMIALYPSPLTSMAIQMSAKFKAGREVPIRILLSDKEGNPVRGLQPLQITVTDAQGKINAISDYYCAENGIYTLPFMPAVNDARGKWAIEVTDLTAGLKKTQTFQVVD